MQRPSRGQVMGASIVALTILALGTGSGGTFARFSDSVAVPVTAQAGVWTESQPNRPPVPPACGNIGSYSEVIYGTPRNDDLKAGNGKTIVMGLGGDDVIRGGNGKDCLVGGTGDDVLKGGNGKDILIGGSGRDTYQGGNGKDLVIGVSEEDRVFDNKVNAPPHRPEATMSVQSSRHTPTVATTATDSVTSRSRPTQSAQPKPTASWLTPTIQPTTAATTTPSTKLTGTQAPTPTTSTTTATTSRNGPSSPAS